MATIDEILDAIEKATADEKKAFKKALGVTEDAKFERTGDPRADKAKLEIEAERARILKETAKAMNNIVELEKQKAEEIAIKTELALMEEKKRLQNEIDDMQDSLSEAEIANINNSKKALDEIIEKVKRRQELNEDESATLLNMNEALSDSLGLYKEVVEEQEKVNNLSREAKEANQDFVNSIGKAVGLQDKYTKSFIGSYKFMVETLQGEEGEAAQKDLQNRISTLFSIQNIASNVASKIFSESVKVLTAFDQGLANIASKTGTVDKFNDVLYDTQRAGNLLGVSMNEAAGSIITLNAQTSMFAALSKKTQTDLAIATSQFEKLGVSSQDTALFMENAFKIMNMGAEEAIVVQKELAMAGVELGIGAEKIVKDFNAASKTLAVYGRQSIDVFKGVAAAAKAANVETSTLLGMVERYDTFAGAAEGSAKLNALLGTQLSTTQMLMMTEDERIETLVASVQAQGVAFGDMDKYTQKAIAAAAGINDMNEANRIFGMSLKDYEANRRQMEENTEAQQKFDDAVQATVPVMNKFKNLATEMIVMVQPALETLGEVADYLTDFFQSMDKETKEYIGTFALFTAGILTIAPLFTLGSGFLAGLAAIGPAIAGVGTGIAAAAAALTGIASTGIGAVVLGGLMAAGAGLAATMAVVAASKAEVAKANAEIVSEGSRTIDSLQEISQSDFSGLATNFGAAMTDLKDIAGDAKVTATLQNLSLINAGTAVSLTGAKIASSSTNLTTNVSNMFDNMTISLKTGAGKEFEAYVEGVAAKVAVS